MFRSHGHACHTGQLCLHGDKQGDTIRGVSSLGYTSIYSSWDAVLSNVKGLERGHIFSCSFTCSGM